MLEASTTPGQVSPEEVQPGEIVLHDSKKVRVLQGDDRELFTGENAVSIAKINEKFAKDFPGFVLPSNDYVRELLANQQENEDFQKLIAGAGDVTELTIVTMNATEDESGGSETSRVELRKNVDGKWEEVKEDIDNRTKTKSTLRASDVVFLVKSPNK